MHSCGLKDLLGCYASIIMPIGHRYLLRLSSGKIVGLLSLHSKVTRIVYRNLVLDF